MTSDQIHVIVGASLAGARAAETLREEGFDGRVVLIGTERERPYERPPLSKDYLRGEAGRDKVYVHDESFYAEKEIELRLGRTAESLDLASSELVLDDGERLRYDRLLLTTGAEPRRLSLPGSELDGIFYLRDVGDSDTLRARLDRRGSAVVVGAGWIGAEVAASARQRGLDVTVVEPASVPLEHVLGPELGTVYRDIHTDHGVRMLLGTGVEAFEGAARWSASAPTTGASSSATSSSWASACSRERASPHGRASRWTTASSSTNTFRPAPRGCSRPGTRPTRATPSTTRRSGSSTGPTR